jgi:tripartite-type tricarboxylate transporter receptor subunit TctC
VKLIAAAAALMFAYWIPAASQEAYPGKKQITLVTPFPAGGGSDILTRILGESFRKTLGTQVVVMNVGGAGGTIGSAQVARATPDGYTILLIHIGMSTAPALYKNLTFDPMKSFEHVGLFAEAPKLLMGGKDFAPNNAQELVDYLRIHKDQVNFATAGVGSAGHLCALLLEESLGVRFTQIQYKGGAPALLDVMSGRADLFCEIPPPLYAHIKSGALKAYMHASEQRMPTLPEVPTSHEVGLKQFTMSVWYGLYAPAGTPKSVIDRLSQALQDAIRDPGVKADMDKLGIVPFEPSRATPAGLKQHLQSQIDLWTPIIKRASEANITAR